MTEKQQPTAPTGFSPVTEARLQEIAQRIVEAFDPERIILFGSYATGQPTACRPSPYADLCAVS